ncbi:hypothetical protein TIFTF001_055231 [Ficus carica]|uniref:Uncharacterized protein n=1 Tax=Ficus carica TaxID=3494 RepID=A0AA88JFC7_FICCA|nr:hypothetical protein TIFTF001_055231 [Ficus carica]
MRRRVRCGK